MKAFLQKLRQELPPGQRSSFPHRKLRKENPSIGSKSIPLHNLQVHRAYNGSSESMHTTDAWAYVPIKKSLRKQDQLSEEKPRRHTQNSETELENNVFDRSQVTFKKNLRRKEKSQKKEAIYLSQIIKYKERENLFRGFQTSLFFQEGLPYQQHKSHQIRRLQNDWKPIRQRTVQMLQDKCNRISDQVLTEPEACRQTKYSQMMRKSKGFKIKMFINRS